MYGHFDQVAHTALRKYQFSQARLYRRLKLQQMRSGILSKNEIVMSQMVEAGQTFSSTNNVLPENSITDVGTLSSDEDVSDADNDVCEDNKPLQEPIPEIPENIVLLLKKAEDTEILDFGDPTCICFYCNALMWPNEKTGKIKSSGQAAFSLCCLKGKVTLPFLRNPPSLLMDLWTDKDPRATNFKENIRAYNSMFAFTSMGGKVRDHLSSDETSQLSVRLFRARGKDPRTYNMPTADEVAALIVGDFDDMEFGRDVVVKLRDGFLTKIHETHIAFIPLQYPLLFPYGEDGFREDIPISELLRNMVLNSRRLFQQFVVDTYTMVEANRLSYLKRNQKTIRADYLNGVAEAIDNEETDPSSVGKRIILPPSFTGGRRYMFNNCQDAMAICKKFGYPDLFITATCNFGWGEIQRFVRHKNLKAEVRPDICVRVFKMKLDNLMSDLKKGKIFGKVDAGVPLDNGFVVPYNPVLLMRYQGHINVEYCNKSNAIKYLFKYINKGPDRVNVQISNGGTGADNSEQQDEIKQYYDCRYLTPCEAAWRTFKYDIHDRWPPMLRLGFHLPNQQSVLFKENDDLEVVKENSTKMGTQFLAWMHANKKYSEGRNLTYAEFPSKFVYNKKSTIWLPRKRGISLGRLQFIAPGMGENYYMHVLLNRQKGCDSFKSIRTVKGVVYPTFRDACEAMGLLEDDREYVDAISIANLRIEDEELQNLCLIEIEKILQGNGRSLKEFPCLPYPKFSDIHNFENRFIADELNYNRDEMVKIHDELVGSLTSEQEIVYKNVLDVVLSDNGGFFFLYGFGGTGKTFV
ncbi:uncharacterized protein LOC130725620 [Lotus japonicus]|uniref:uncharacterized protein LOC130725620 n=1 Tax=Lotus japonicus TaxID=34305 RepID=UPI002584CAC0|nr:uncharacterized protein LOC130725620 [Lotus japonicus]